MSADISNELSYRNPGKYIAVAYKNGNAANISLRGKNVKEILEKVLKELEEVISKNRLTETLFNTDLFVNSPIVAFFCIIIL